MDKDVIAVHANVEQKHWWFAARRSILRALAGRLVPPVGRPVVVDIGCGVGATLTAFSSDYHCVGFDPSADSIAHGRRAHPEIDLRVGTAADAANELSRADIVFLNDVIEHVEDDQAVLRPVVQALRPGAFLIITVPADMKLWSPHDVALGHFRRYDPVMLRSSVGALPLEELMLSHFNARLYPIVRGVRAVAQRVGRSSGAEGTDLRMTPEPANRMLRGIFAGEAKRLLRVLDGSAGPYTHGVSLIGIYRRTVSA